MTDCRTCWHPADDHDAGECWAQITAGRQCPCVWYRPDDPDDFDGLVVEDDPRPDLIVGALVFLGVGAAFLGCGLAIAGIAVVVRTLIG